MTIWNLHNVLQNRRACELYKGVINLINKYNEKLGFIHWDIHPHNLLVKVKNDKMDPQLIIRKVGLEIRDYKLFDFDYSELFDESKPNDSINNNYQCGRHFNAYPGNSSQGADR